MRNVTRILASVVFLSAAPNAAATTDATRVVLPGAVMEIRFSGAVDDDKATELVNWIRDTAHHVSDTYGRFPVPSPRVVVIPTRASSRHSSPVPFGRVTRGGGEAIELYVDVSRPIDELYADWTATHEFSHLMLPRISWQQRWLSEGFASYYQNVLMTRAGHYTPAEGIRRLTAGIERGRASRPGLSPNAAAREGIGRARMKIYWSGAALALLADLEIRDRTDGRDSLDGVLGRFQACCLPSERRWSGREFLTRLDSMLAEPVFMPLYRRYADAPGFPDVTDALRDPRLRDDIFVVRTSPN